MGLKVMLPGKWFLAIVAFAAIPAAGPAQTKPAAAGRIVLRAGSLLDVRTGQLLKNQDIVVQDGMIAAVRPASGVKTEGMIDLSNATVLPGLIDAHSHITGDPQISDSDKLLMSNERRALKGARNARLTLEAGFTTIRNAGSDGYPDVALRDAIRDGDIPGPRIIASGPAISITGGSCDNIRMAYQYGYTSPGVADGVEGVQKKVREVIKYGADAVKMCVTGGLLAQGERQPGNVQYTAAEIQAAVAAAHGLGRRIFAHAHGPEGIRLASEAGVDSVEHCFLIDDAAIAVLKKNGTYLVPTLYVADWIPANDTALMQSPVGPQIRQVMAQAKTNLQRAFQAGVKIAFGTDAAVFPHGENAHEFARYVELGMTPMQAIQTATVNAADLLGLRDKAGVVEPGRWADLIAVEGDPTQNVRTLEKVIFVMKAGVVATRPTELPRQH
jgi:imidazolonepropionase-like amidohydrolase